MSRRHIRNRSRRFARTVQVEPLEIRQLLSAVLPDLIVTNSVLTLGTISQGQNDHIDWTVKNTGTAATPDGNGWYDAVVATTDTTFDPNSSHNNYLAFPGNPNGLDINQTYTQGADFGTYGWAPGTYHIFVITDDGNWLTESNENNNISISQALTVNVPDLTVKLNSATPSPIGLNKNLSLNWTVTNSASAPGSTENGWTDVVYISPNSTLNTSDPATQAIGYFGNINTSPMNPGDSYTTSTTSPPQVTIPTSIAPGTYYIFVQTNQFTGQGETDTTNDISNAISIQVTAADLIVASAQADSGTHTVGDTIPISWTVKNQGNATADGAYGGTDWHDAVYWSYSSTFDGNARWIGDLDYSAADGAGALAPGQSYAAPQQFNVDTTGWDGGQYYFFVQTDWYGWQEPESNENNNVSAAIPVYLSPTGATPDLTVTLNSTGGSTAQLGSNLEVNFTVKNSSSATASTGAGTSWWDAVWLSPTPALDTSKSQVIGYLWNGFPTTGSPTLAPGQSYTQDNTVQIPDNFGTGQFYIIIGTDTFNNISESNGANNLSSDIPITLTGSDLQMNDFQVNGQDANVGYTPDIGEVPMGQPLNVQWNVSNEGNEATQNEYSDAVYLSTTTTFNAATARLIYYSTEPDGGPLDNGDNYTQNAAITLSTLPNGPGTYYLFVVTDAFGDEPEGNENNNVSNPIQFEVTGPDLSVTSATVNNYGISADPNTIILDQDFNISWSVENDTNDNINSGWYDSVYISQDSTFDSQDATQLITFQPEPDGIGGFGSSYGTGFDMTLYDWDYAPGQYYIYVVTDDGNAIPESNENNDIAVIPVTVLGADLTVTTASVLPAETSVGSSATVSWTVQNQGDAAASNGWDDEIYISTSSTFNPDTAVDIGSQFEGYLLNPGDSYSTSTTVDLSSFPNDGGPYYLFVVTDNYNNQGENDETNNVSAAIPLTLDPISQADLTTSINASQTASSATVGNFFNVQWTDSNIGTASTQLNWTDEFWLSPTSTFDPSTAIDLGGYYTGGSEAASSNLGSSAISPAIAAGGNNTITTSLYMPADIGVGTFYLFVQADVYDNQPEITYTNNFNHGIPITVLGSDLTVTDTSLPDQPPPLIAPGGATVYAGGLAGYYYGTGSNGVGSIADAETYIASNPALAQFTASQLQYPSNQGLGSTEDDSNNLGSFLGGDSLSFSNPLLLSNQLSGQIMEFDGFISLSAGPNTLWLGTDDGGEVFLNGSSTPFISDTGPHSFTWDGNTFNAPSDGLYPIKIIYYEEFGGTGVGLATGPDTGHLQTVSSNDLYSPNPKIVSNQQFEIDWNVANNGNIPTQYNFWYDSVYLSSTPVFDPSTAILLASQSNANNDYLANGDSYSAFADIQIPASLGGGTKYLFISTDDNNYEPEGNEENNLSAPIAITVTAPQVDLEPTAFVAPYFGVLGETMTGTLEWTVANNGSTNANGDWNDELYLSQNPWVDANSIQLGMFDAYDNGWTNFGYYGSSYSTDQSNSVSIPGDISLGNYYLILVTNGDHGQGEYDYNNNSLVHPITIVSPDDDLVVTDASVNSTDLVAPSTTPVLAPGQNLNLQMTVTNQGSADATNSWTDGVYLSPDGQLDDAILLAVAGNSYLTAGDSYSETLYQDGFYTPAIPSDTAPGTYYLLFVTDINNDQPESNEANNIFSAQITVAGPDLIVSSVSVLPTSGNVGGTYTASWTVKNQGDGPAATGGWYDTLYVSSSPTFNASTATYIGSLFNTSTLNQGDSYNQNYTFIIPGGFAIGNVYVFVDTDSGNYVPETNDNNNISSPFTVNIAGGADLQAKNVVINSVIPTPPTENSTVSLTWKDVNNGNVSTSATSWYDFVYLSNSSTFDLSSAIEIGDFQITPGTLAANGGSYTVNETATLPGNLEPGNYWIFVEADNPVYGDYFNGTDTTYEYLANGFQPETNETNNVSAGVQISIGQPDLTVTTASTPAQTLSEGQTSSAQWTVKNLSSTYTAAGSWIDTIYLSTTPDLSGNLTYLWSSYVGANSPLAPGAMYNNNNSGFTIPTNIQAGTYYLVFETDSNAALGETNENNNIYSIPITITNPDLTVTSVMASPNPVAVGNDLTVTWTVKNLANVPAYGGWYDAAWLSTDGQIDSSSIALGYLYENGNGNPVLQPAGTVSGGTHLDQYTQTQQWIVPSWTPSGNYQVIIMADGGYNDEYYNYSGNYYYSASYDSNLVAETNENNNTGSTAVTVAHGITVSSAYVGTTPGQSFNATFSADVSASLSASTLVLTPLFGGAAASASTFSFNHSTNTATFGFSPNLTSGIYQAKLPASSIYDISGDYLISDYVFDFLLINNNGSLALPAGSQVFTVQQVIMGTSATLDLGNNVLVDQYSTAAPPPSFTALINSGFNNGAWNGKGIISSAAASDTTHASGVGAFDTGSQFTIARTWYGDANVDGKINADDISLIMLGQSQSGTRWQDGDFTYNSHVNADDWMKTLFGIAVSKTKSLGVSFPSVIIASSENMAVANATKVNSDTTGFSEVPISNDDLNHLLETKASVL